MPTTRATLIGAEPFGSEADAEAWLERMHGDPDALAAAVHEALRELNKVLRAHRAAAADPYAREVAARSRNAVRVGFGSGEQVADGHFAAAYERAAAARGARERSVALAPQERLAAVLGGGSDAARGRGARAARAADLDAGRRREAALQARIALEALLAELGGGAAAQLEQHRQAVGGGRQRRAGRRARCGRRGRARRGDRARCSAS